MKIIEYKTVKITEDACAVCPNCMEPDSTLKMLGYEPEEIVIFTCPKCKNDFMAMKEHVVRYTTWTKEPSK